MNNFNFYNRFNLWSPIQPASFTDSLSYLQHIEILRGKINEVIENLNNANFYARGLKPGKAIDIVGATKGSGFFNGEDPTIINTVINNSVLTGNKPGLYKIFSTKVVNEEMKSGLTFLFQEQPLNHNCETDKLSWGILKINFVYNPTDADIDYNTYNIKIVDFAFEEERNLTDKLDRFMLVRRINPCNAENVMELYYRVPTKEEATECADACGPAALFTLLNIDNREIEFNTYIKLENEGLNTTTYDGINGIITNPVINFDYDDITLIGDTEGYGLMNTRNVKVDPTTTPQLIDSFDSAGDVEMRKVNVLKNHRPYDEEPTTNDIVFNMEVPKLIDNITVENTGDVEGEGSVEVQSVQGAENNVKITVENTFNEDAFKESVSEAIKDPTIKEEIGDIFNEYSSAGGGIPADGSMVVYLAPVSGDDSKDGLTEDNAMKTMNALLNKGYAKELEVHLVGESPSAEGEGIIVVNGANYTLIKIIDEVAILAGYSLEVNNSNVIISTDLPSTMPYDEILIEEDTIIDYDSTTERLHYNCYTISNDFAVYTLNETEPEGEPETETYYNIMPLQLTMGNMYSLEATNSIIDIQGTFTDILNCKLENTTLNNSIQNLNYHTNSFNTVIFNFDNSTLPVILNGEVVNSTFNSNANPTSGGAYQYYITTDTVMFNGCTFNYVGINELTYLLFVNGYINNLYIKYTGGSTQPRGKRNIQKTTGSLIYSAAISTSQSTNLSYSDITLKEATIQQLETLISSLYVSTSTSISLPVFTRGLYSGNRRNVYASTNYPGYVKVDGETITIDSNGVISATGGGGGSTYELPIASNTTLGGVKVGENLSIDETGVLSAEITDPYTLPTASTSVLGGVKVDGETITIDSNGVISSTGGTAELPIATTEVLGGVKVGSGLSITEDGVLSTTGEISGDVNLIPHNETEITYYVSGLDGNDETNTGLTPDSPLMTLSGALNKHSSRIIKIIFDGTLPQDNSITETYIDGFGYRRINLDYVKYGFEDLSEPNLYGPPLYVKNAGLTLNILPRTLRSLNSYVVATHTDGQPSHTPYNITIENSILQLNDFESLDTVENDYIDKFIVRNSKVDFTYNGKNQSSPDDYNFIIRYGVIENSIIDTTNVQLDFLHNAESEHYISGSTIRGCVIDFNKQADVSGEDKYLYMNDTSILLKNSALDSTPTISIEKSVLTNCTIANSGYNVNSANTIIANSYLTNCDLDIKLNNNSVSNTLKGCRITGVINNTISHTWVLNTTATDCDFRVSVPYNGLVSGLTLTRCTYVGTELTDEHWTLDNTIVNGINKNSAESN